MKKPLNQAKGRVIEGRPEKLDNLPYEMPSHHENVSGEEDFTWTSGLVQVGKR